MNKDYNFDIKINSSYDQFLKNINAYTQLVYQFNINRKNNQIFVSSSIPKLKELPPNNSIIDFSKINKYNLNSSYLNTSTLSIPLPSHFNWYETDIGKKLIKPLNQGKCGSCWAFSIISCIQDNFILKNVIPFNPNLDISELMSCWTNSINSKCQGSNPAMALLYIERNGISSSINKDNNFDWCINSSKCFSNDNSSILELNSLIPKCKNNDTIKFFIKNIRASPLTLSLYQENSNNLNINITMIKSFIFNNGTVIGNFNVFENFSSGGYLCNGNNPNNIYLDQVDYITGSRKMDMNFKFIGGHSVVIVGWSIGKVKGILLDDNYKNDLWYDVPYWIVRNSWGEDWCMNGFFHMAMYPFNKYSQFDITVNVRSNIYNDITQNYEESIIPTGGFLLFDILSFQNNNSTLISNLPKNISNQNDSKNDNLSVYITIFILLTISLLTIIFIIIYSIEKK